MSTPSSQLIQARNGDPQVIASLLNTLLQPKGVSVRAVLQDNTLKIALMGKQMPPQDVLAPPLEKALTNLAPAGIESVTLYGFLVGNRQPQWLYSFSLPSSEVPSPAPQPEELSQNGDDATAQFLADLDLSALQAVASIFGLEVNPPERHRVEQAIVAQIDQLRRQEEVTEEDEGYLRQVTLALRITHLGQMSEVELIELLAQADTWVG